MKLTGEQRKQIAIDVLNNARIREIKHIGELKESDDELSLNEIIESSKQVDLFLEAITNLQDYMFNDIEIEEAKL